MTLIESAFRAFGSEIGKEITINDREYLKVCRRWFEHPKDFAIALDVLSESKFHEIYWFSDDSDIIVYKFT